MTPNKRIWIPPLVDAELCFTPDEAAKLEPLLRSPELDAGQKLEKMIEDYPEAAVLRGKSYVISVETGVSSRVRIFETPRDHWAEEMLGHVQCTIMGLRNCLEDGTSSLNITGAYLILRQTIRTLEAFVLEKGAGPIETPDFELLRQRLENEWEKRNAMRAARGARKGPEDMLN